MSLFPGIQYKWFKLIGDGNTGLPNDSGPPSGPRAAGVYYQNTENAPIFVFITYSGRGGGMTCGPTQSAQALVYTHGGAGAVAQWIFDTPNISFICPVNFWYRLEPSGIRRVHRWHEMRQAYPQS